ncbi:MAG: hypothetical protein HY719_02695 [Planctomycetes bacterium]|nr:hypothetical protein [Planctomycetota bacterium]
MTYFTANKFTFLAVVALFAAFLGARGCLVDPALARAENRGRTARAAKLSQVRESLVKSVENGGRSFQALIDEAKARAGEFGAWQERVAEGVSYRPSPAALLRAGMQPEEINAVEQNARNRYEEIVGKDARFDAVWKTYNGARNDSLRAGGAAAGKPDDIAARNQRLAALEVLTTVAAAARETALRQVTALDFLPVSSGSGLHPVFATPGGYLSLQVVRVEARGREEDLHRFLLLCQAPVKENAPGKYLCLLEAEMVKEVESFLSEENDPYITGRFKFGVVKIDPDKALADPTAAGGGAGSPPGGAQRARVRRR